MNAPKILTLVGARPQLIKASPFSKALQNHFVEILVHSGQHYDPEMSAIFFEELQIPSPHYTLQSGNQSDLQQISAIICKLEPIVQQEKPVAFVVFGDTNTTLAGAIVATKLNIPLIHIEAGLRSFVSSMPEEQNRIVTDHLSQLLFAPTLQASEQLKKEQVQGKIILSADIMMDSLRLAQERLENQPRPAHFPPVYYLCTIHRPINTDNATRLKEILDALGALPYPVLFPLHPRTQKRFQEFGLQVKDFPAIQFLPPQSFLKMVQLQQYAKRILTDSGGIQKEAYWNRVPCITLRQETEWPETLQNDWNQLIFSPLTSLPQLLQKEPGEYLENLYGHGFVAQTIVQEIKHFLENDTSVSTVRSTLYLLIPIYNEAQNIPKLFEDLRKIQQKLSQYQLEIILCDDGSQDNTKEITQQLAGSLSITLLGDGKNYGPGHAFADGFAWLSNRIKSQDLVVTMEGDNTSRVETLLAMIERLERESWDCVLASPYAYGGKITQTNFFRIFLSMTANLLVRFILKIPGIFTMSSFFRVYRGSLIQKLQQQFGSRILKENGFICMIELLQKMTSLSTTISEYPLVLDTSRRVGKSKMRITKTSLEYLKYLFFTPHRKRVK